MLKGSLTVFASMIIAFVMILIFTMAECIRIYALHDMAQGFVDEGVESAFSEYNPYLYANYRILAVDFAYGTYDEGPSKMESKILSYCDTNADVESGYNYTRMNGELCELDQYSLLTDDGGAGVIMLGVKATEQGLAAQAIDGIEANIDVLNNIEAKDVESEIKNGTDNLENAKRELAAKKEKAANDDNPDTNPEDYEDPGEVEDNPLVAYSALRESFSNGILSTVVQKEVALSEEKVELSDLPSYRVLNQGTMSSESGAGLVDRALFIDYLLTNYSYYGKDRGHDGMDYELEYLIVGKESDTQNLASVVERILLIREAANFATIQKSTAMKAEARAVANILAGFTMNPAIIETVYYAIMGAWAYAESTMDLRLLLDGGKVPAIKTESQWSTDVWHLSAIVDVGNKAKDCGTGLTYKDYLIGMLSIETNSTLGLRCCDVMENALNETLDYSLVKLDNMTFAIDASVTFSAEEMFLSIFDIAPQLSGNYNITKHKNIGF